jgi:DNA-binding transcriptional LysR family regulator
MELRHLRYFVAVAQACSFTRAAAELRVAQPALSRQVQDLEDEIGVDLFVRSPRGVTLTAEGKLFLDELRRYPFCVAAAPEHSFKRLKAVPLEKLASEPVVAFNRRDYSEHFRILDEIFSPKKLRPRIAVEVDGASSLIARKAKSDLAPAGEKFCQSLRKIAA